MRQTTASIQRAMARQEGFTLLELMVTLVVSSLVVLAAYQIFASTSEAMYEANSLSDTTDRARFGLELIARDVRAAGAFGSPDSPSDPFVNQAQLDLRRVRGLYAYDGHYNRQAGDFQTLWNQATRSDSIVLLGAYDFPFSFEVRFPNGDMGDFNQAFSPNTERGALRFLSLDPFVMALNTTQDIGPLTRALMGPGPADDRLIRSRVLRVMDRNGFSQFASIDSATYTPGVNEGLRMALTPGPGALRAKVGDERAGLEPGGEEDVGYEAALLDAYRYRVCFTSAGNLHLVKERLNADLLLDHIELAISDDCSVDPVGPNEQIVERTVLVDRVVDFRVWYDCAPMGQATLVDATWATGWMVPTPASATTGHACAYLDRSTGAPMAGNNPALVRMAHIRLSVRTEQERGDMPNYGFLLADGSTLNASSAPNSAQFIVNGPVPATGDLSPNVVGPLQTADIDGDPSNAARVVTMQIDVQLTNYLNRLRLTSPQGRGNDDTFR